MRLEAFHEVPPTAGLPPRWRDLLPWRGPSLAARAAEFLGVEEVQVTCSGTAALVVALTALKRRSARTDVIVPAYTCPLVAIAVAHCGLTLRPCDLVVNGIDMDPATLAALCDDNTLAIVPTHLGGRVADVDTALACAHRVGAWVIEDAAQALGARFADDASIGTKGNIGFFSLAVGKGLTTYEGGLLIAGEAGLREDLRRCGEEIARYDAALEIARSAQLIGYHAIYRPLGLTLAYGLPRRNALRSGDAIAAVGDDFSLSIPLHRMGDWRDGVGARAFVRLHDFQEKLDKQAVRRRSRLGSIAAITVFQDRDRVRGTWPFFLICMPTRAARDAALSELWASHLGVSRLFIHALPDYAYLRDIVSALPLPNAREFAARTLTVSNSLWLGDEEFEQIACALERACANRNGGAV